MTEIETRLRIQTKGIVEVYESGPLRDEGGRVDTELVDTTADEMHLLVAMYDGRVEVEVRVFRALNDETDRAFNASLTASLSDSALRRLHVFLGYLLRFPDVIEPDEQDSSE